jgi:Holliday junction resolvase RusA-like endonuclease
VNPDLYHAKRLDGELTRVWFPQPGPLLNLNHRVHWSRRAAVTKQWRTAAYWAATTLGPPDLRAHDHRYVQMIIPVPDRRRRDPSNLIPLLKAAIDGLVDAHIWPDDTPDYVTTIEPYLFVQRPTLGEAPTIELALYRQPPARHTQENP